jgi:hypothetical protein
MRKALDMPTVYEEPHKTTISFLTLPGVFSYENSSGTECPAELEHYRFTSHMSTFVDFESLGITASEKRRFARALKILNLQPFVHPAQLTPTELSVYRGANQLQLSKSTHPDWEESKNAVIREKIEKHVQSESKISFD